VTRHSTNRLSTVSRNEKRSTPDEGWKREKDGREDESIEGMRGRGREGKRKEKEKEKEKERKNLGEGGNVAPCCRSPFQAQIRRFLVQYPYAIIKKKNAICE